MFCPQCNRSFDKHLLCPVCGARLTFHTNVGATGGGDDEPWQQTPWGRLLVGLLVAQGLAQALRQVTTAGLAVSGNGADSVWSTLMGLVLWHILQGMSLIVGGALAGAGQNRGVIYGCVVGLINGLIFLAMQQRDLLIETEMIGELSMHLAFGGLGGLIGRMIWKPLPTVKLAIAPEHQGKGSARPSEEHAFSGPIAWVRVLAGSVMVIAGTVWAQSIMLFVVDASQGTLSISTHLQAQLVSWEISALATLMGAAFAGATTRNGLKQGLCVGLGAAIMLIGIQLGDPKVNLDHLIGTIASTLVLCLAGGWFGCQLFPPVSSQPRHRIDAMV
jgi:hypothetical protein